MKLSELKRASVADPRWQGLLSEAVERTVLDNGLTLIVKETDASPLISMQAWVKTGSIHEGELLGCGLSHYLEHLLFKGSGQLSAKEWIEAVQAIGASTNAYTTFDRTVYYIDGPAESWERTLDLLFDLVAQTRFDPGEMAREKSVILREIDMGLDDPDQQLMQGLLQTAFRIHPNRHPIIGYRSLFNEVSPEEVEAYYRRRYSPDNVVLVVAGVVDTAAVVDAVSRTWGALERKRIGHPLIPSEPDQLGSRNWGSEADIHVFRGAFAWKIPGLTHRDAPALDLLASILGSGDSALLWQEIRDKRRLVHDIDAAAWTPQEGQGLFWLNYTADPQTGGQAREAIVDFLHKVVASPVPEAMLEKARCRALVSEINARKTVSGQAARLGAAEVCAGDLGYPRAYLERILTLSPEDVAAAGQRAFTETTQTTASMAPRGTGIVRSGTGRRPLTTAAAFAAKTLSNGAQLLVQEDHRLPKIHLRIIFRGGPLYEPDGKRGITQLLATMLTRDTERRSAEAVAERIESVGGYFAEFCGNNTFGLSVEVLPEHLKLAVEVLEEALFFPHFREETLEVERSGQISEIEETLDDVVPLGRYHLRQAFFGAHPFRFDSLGSADDVARLCANDLSIHQDALIAGGNCALAICGDFSSSDLQLVEERLSRLRGGSWQPRDGSFSGPAATGRQELTAPREQAVVFSAFPDVGQISDGWIFGELLHECLSGMSSRLFRVVREEQGMAYFVSASRWGGLQGGQFTLFAGTHPDQAESVLVAFNEELDRLREGRWEPGELDRCKTRLRARRVAGLQTPGARALQAGLNALYGLPINDWQDYPERLAAVNAEALQTFARKQLDDARRLDFVVHP